jgi:hypothetical protein
MYAVAAALGVACVASLAIGGRYFAGVVPEWAAQLAWLAVVLGGSAICGYRSPARAWRWGAVLVGVQPPFFWLLLWVVGDIAKPSDPLGGMAAVFIFGFFMLFVCPVAMLASYLGSRARAGRLARQGASP